MKKALYLGAAAVAVIAAPAFADVSGYVEGNYEYAKIDPNSGTNNHQNSFGLAGAVVDSFSNGWNVQGDGETTDQSWHNSSSDDAHSYQAVHAFKRTDAYAIGGFVGLANVYDWSVRMLGAEGQLYYSNITLDGAVTYGNASDSPSDQESWGVSGGGSYFFNENLAVTGKLAYTSFDNSSSQTFDDWSAGIGAEYQFGQAPVSIFAAYNYTNDDGPSGSGYDNNSFKIGARMNFGTKTLQDRTNKGASMVGAQNLFDAWRVWE
jgi:hypothetical protein